MNQLRWGYLVLAFICALLAISGKLLEWPAGTNWVCVLVIGFISASMGLLLPFRFSGFGVSIGISKASDSLNVEGRSPHPVTDYLRDKTFGQKVELLDQLAQEQKKVTGVRVGITFASQEDAPSCADCGSIMVRQPTCFKCLNCGSTAGHTSLPMKLRVYITPTIHRDSVLDNCAGLRKLLRDQNVELDYMNWNGDLDNLPENSSFPCAVRATMSQNFMSCTWKELGKFCVDHGYLGFYDDIAVGVDGDTSKHNLLEEMKKFLKKNRPA
ncbi:MAG: hypothetical protein HZA95_02965 [Candidatus Vogelbacteria bacterium]|nr:hypothetical protein [Candidatus Vogelbacteria bacterium]